MAGYIQKLPDIDILSISGYAIYLAVKFLLGSAMNEELIVPVANVLEEWNPLGEQASSVDGLDGYRTEAIDILSSSSILKKPIKEVIATVLAQAFDLSLDESQLNYYGDLIERMVNEH